MGAAADRGSLPRMRAGMRGCGLGGSAGFSAGFCESDKLNLHTSNRQHLRSDQ
jgi:hypothetical protein